MRLSEERSSPAVSPKWMLCAVRKQSFQVGRRLTEEALYTGVPEEGEFFPPSCR